MNKIMFNDGCRLTKAVEEGLKDRTSRLEKSLSAINADAKSPFVDYAFGEYNSKSNEILAKRFFKGHLVGCLSIHPRFKVGEVVAVAQPYCQVFDTEAKFRAAERKVGQILEAGYRDKMFVRADLMPHQIRITSVRVERLQDIRYDDCLREGVRVNDSGLRFFTDPKLGFFETPRHAFSVLIDRISGKGTWSANPFVVVYFFELVK